MFLPVDVDDHVNGLLSVGVVLCGGRDCHTVALAHETRQVWLHHQLLGSRHDAVDVVGVQVVGVCHSRELPLRVAVWHVERECHLALLVCHQSGQEERSLYAFIAEIGRLLSVGLCCLGVGL